MPELKPLDHIPALKADDPIYSAFRAISHGVATGRQQQMALGYILSHVCEVNRPMRAGLSAYDAGYAAGLRQAGICISSLAGLVLFRSAPLTETEDDTEDE